MARLSPEQPRPKAKPDAGLVGEYVIEPGGHDEPPIGAEIRRETVRWDLVMTFFLRVVAAFWLVKGIGFWGLIIGLGDLPLAEERRLRQAFIVAFAILDCAAAVGLWLLSPWGKSLWLFLVAIEIVLGLTAFLGLFGYSGALGASVLVVMFFALAYAMQRAKL
jgi:hypothetical protein